MSTLASRVPQPSCMMKLLALSMCEYVREKLSPSILLLTLPPWGCDKSTIKPHFPGQPHFGMTRKWLRCSGLAKGEETKGPATLSSETSLARHCSTTPGLHVCCCGLETRDARGLETNCEASLKTRKEILVEE